MIGMRLTLVIVALLAAAASAQQVDQGQRPLAITRVNVIDLVAGVVASDMTVVVQDGRIVSVGNNSPAPRGAAIVARSLLRNRRRGSGAQVAIHRPHTNDGYTC